MLERLEFIDTVMELLPYGFRSRMTAATWTRATNRNHRFRLFFSSAPRADEPDYVVIWGDDPDLVRVPDGEAGEYFDWLQDNIGPLARLAELTSEMGFGPKDTLQALEAVLGTRHRLHLRPRPVAPASNGRPGLPSAPPAPVQGDLGEEALVACAEHAEAGEPDPAALRHRLPEEVRRGRDQRGAPPALPEPDRRARACCGTSFPSRTSTGKSFTTRCSGWPSGPRSAIKAYCRVEKCAGLAPRCRPAPAAARGDRQVRDDRAGGERDRVLAPGDGRREEAEQVADLRAGGRRPPDQAAGPRLVVLPAARPDRLRRHPSTT